VVAFRQNFERAMNRFSGGLLAWLFGEPQHDDYWNADRALMYAPVWNCVSTISGAFAIMPLNLHRKQGRNITQQTDHASYKLLRWRPNNYQAPAQWKRQMLCHALLWGNARSYIHRDSRGRPVELIPLMPDRTSTILADGVKWHYTIVGEADRLPYLLKMQDIKQENIVWMEDREVWHVPGLGYDGIVGKSLISIARQSWQVGLGAETHVRNQQKKGYAGGLMLEAPQGVLRSEKDAQDFLTAFQDKHAGTENSGKVALLREGIKANVLAMNNADAQFIEQRRFQREDAALWFLLQGILGDSSNASYNSLEQKNLAYRTNCLAPWTTAIEEECDLKLLTERERMQDYYHKFNDGALLRTEKAQTMAFISQGVTSRVLSPNEGRAMLDLNPYEGGDTYENPAVTPGVPGGEPKDDTREDATEDMEAERARIRHLIGVESRKVIDAAQQAVEKGKNFVDWIDNFYAGRWLANMNQWMKEIGIESDFASLHCEISKELLLQACGQATAENLVEVVTKTVQNWPIRAELARKER
jgi:HK97 family phage portal protein